MPTGRLGTFLAAALVAVGLLAAGPAGAAGDPPARVGRVSLLSGPLAQRAPGESDWSPAVLNEPVTSGDAFRAEPGSRAELRIGSAAIHLDGGTELDFATLDDHVVETTLARGTADFRVRRLGADERYTVLTPRGMVLLAAPGRYHVEAGSDAEPTRVAVFDGRAEIAGDGAARVTLARGEAVELTGTAAAPVYAMVPAAPTDFDEWALARDRRDDEVAALRYVSPEMTGYEDLDDYGSWGSDPRYGAVWYPSAVPAGWAPYRNGHWSWVEPWGWTWVEDEPWGFAPFHYGRWAFVGDRWAWVPGTRIVQPVFAPALVAFVGGVGWGSAFRVGGEPCVGWFPLAPREAFRPAYRASPTYIRKVNVNVTNVNVTNVNVTNVRYANRERATVVPAAAFAARHVERSAVQVPRQILAAAPVAEAPPVAAHPHRNEQRRIADEARHDRAAGPGARAAAPSPRAAPSRESAGSSTQPPLERSPGAAPPPRAVDAPKHGSKAHEDWRKPTTAPVLPPTPDRSRHETARAVAPPPAVARPDPGPSGRLAAPERSRREAARAMPAPVTPPEPRHALPPVARHAPPPPQQQMRHDPSPQHPSPPHPSAPHPPPASPPPQRPVAAPRPPVPPSVAHVPVPAPVRAAPPPAVHAPARGGGPPHEGGGKRNDDPRKGG